MGRLARELLEGVLVRGNVRAALTASLLLAPFGTLQATQDQQQDTKASTIPESAMPPAGMCRVWLKDVPERQQPAPTDCVSAIRTVPRDAMVLFGDLKRSAKVLAPGATPAPAVRQQPARELPGYRGPEVFVGDARGASSQTRRSGSNGVTAATATTPGATATGGTAAASKAPEPKAVIKPEKPQ